MPLLRKVLVAAALSVAGTAATAGVLEITPVLSDVVTPADGATSLTLRNRGATPATVQLRLMRWRVEGGREVTTPAESVGVSPPFATLRPGGSHVVRVVRMSKRPVIGEEAYRLLLDELPEPNAAEGAVALTVRHQLPVFFRHPAAKSADVAWSVEGAPGAQEVVAVNAGQRRMRVSALKLTDAAGVAVDFGAGLAGYVLGGQEQRWQLPPATPLKGRVKISFRDEAGSAKAEADAPLSILAPR